MNLKLLSLSEMVNLSSSWVGSQRAMFLSIPEVAGLMPQIEATHAQLNRVREEAESDALTGALTAQLETLDARHDNAVRAVWHLLTANAAYLRALDPPRISPASELEHLRDALLPDGLAYTQPAYQDEASNAERMIESITDAMRESMKHVPLATGDSLLDAVKLWGKLGARLGDLERRRAEAMHVVSSQVGELQARAAWAKVVELVLNLLNISQAPAEALEAIRGPIVMAVTIAQHREEG